MKIFILFLTIALCNCKPPNLNNPYDPKANDFLSVQALGCLEMDTILCPPVTVSGVMTGLTPSSSVKLRLDFGFSSEPILQNGNFQIQTRGGIFTNLYIAEQPADLHCIIINKGSMTSGIIQNVEITCPLHRRLVDGIEVGYSRCLYGQTWNPNGNNNSGNCQGVGTAGDDYGLVSNITFCNLFSIGGCTGDVTGGTLLPPPWIGSNISLLYNACFSYQTESRWGKTNWRVPSKNEVKQLVQCANGPSSPLDDLVSCNAGYSSPTVNTNIFTNFPTSVSVWTNQSYMIDEVQAFAVDFTNGYTSTPDQDTSLSTLCVTNL
ncbi:DUF1566 domain-containing protein [Leptospira sp. 96542]|nr:DUF1566 domain-containing protein [Leptospira sp. 96542]